MPAIRLRFAALGLICACLLAPVAGATQVTVTPTVTPVGSLFHYDYTVVVDPTAEDFAIVTVASVPGIGVVQGLTAPAGFLANFDTGLGLLDFIGDALTFAPGVPVSGFAFDSPLGPGPTTFTALSVSGMPAQGDTQAPTGEITAPVPEPGVIALIAAVAPAGLLRLAMRRGRRRA